MLIVMLFYIFLKMWWGRFLKCKEAKDNYAWLTSVSPDPHKVPRIKLKLVHSLKNLSLDPTMGQVFY